METNYEQMKSLIIEEIWENNQVKLKFKAKNQDQDQALETVGIAAPDQEEMMKTMKKEMAKMAASNIAINAGANALGGLVGVAGAGSMVSSASSQMGVGYQMDTDKMMAVELTHEVKQQTIVNAFAALQMYYEFKDGAWMFVAP